jgi:D-inositol-3-phosphate glycosyltransferase
LVVIGGPSGAQGDGELLAAHTFVTRSKLEDSVWFRDPVDHAVLSEYYTASDVLLVPSRSESFGLVAVEAQACGLPVVAADVGGLGFAIADGESGYLIDGWDPADFAAAAAPILGNAELAARLSKGGVEHAGQFSWEATAKRFFELYDGIL